MENKTVGIIISVAIAVLMGAILIAIIADTINTKTSLVTYTETLDISSTRLAGGGINASVTIPATVLAHPASTSWRSGYPECAISTVNLYNQTGTLLLGTTNYTWTEDGNGALGRIALANSKALNSSTSNLTTISYQSCPDEYVVSGWQRTILNLVPGFFALAILMVCVFVIFYVLRQEGVELNTN